MKKLLRQIFKIFFLILLPFWGFSQSTAGCNCDYVIPNNVLYLDADTEDINPGDVICIMAGERKYLGLRNFQGTKEKPLTFINCGGKVVVRNNDWHYGIYMFNCRNFRLTGTGDPQHQYGIQIAEASLPGITGLNIGNMSNEVEVDHLEIQNTGFAGILSKTDPDCTGGPNRGNFVMTNTRIHHNFIHDTHGEGIYVGFPHYSGIKRLCGTDSIRVYPHDMVGVKIYENKLENVGREGIQVGCATEGCEIYHNTIRNFGVRNENWQNSGIHISTGTSGIVRHNFIKGGSGAGMWLKGRGGNLIFNNIIADVGAEGFLVYDSLVAGDQGYSIINNTIANCGKDGIKFFLDNGTKNHGFINNIIAGVGGNIFDITNPAEFLQTNNYVTHNIRQAFFVNPSQDNYKLHPFSKGIDYGTDVLNYGIDHDYDYALRPMGRAFDAGAYESDKERYTIDFIIYPNPSIEYAIVSFINYEDGFVALRIYDELGRLMQVVHEGYMEAGVYKLRTEVSHLAAAVYFCELRRQEEVKTKRLVVIK